MNNAYISLGSNQGQRLKNIQDAVVQIQKNIGPLVDLSSCYKTAAWGFEGPYFINACIAIQTVFSPQEVLQKLLQIETGLGRKKATGSGYISRKIDLDLLFYEDFIISDDHLNLPHPRLEERNFVLLPLCEMNPNLIHPVFNCPLNDLLHRCKDPDVPEKMPMKTWTPDLFDQDQYIIFEGNIGVGKTSLAQKIGQDFKVPILLENFSKNPYLEKFYEQPDRYASPLEFYFLEDRFKQFNDFYTNPNTSKKVVSDHSFFKSLVFAKINLSVKDYEGFKKKYERLSAQLDLPQKVIFLQQSLDQLKVNIQIRGRAYEQNMDLDYLKKIDNGYRDFLENEMTVPYCSIDLTALDFIKNEKAYQLILQRIKAF